MAVACITLGLYSCNKDDVAPAPITPQIQEALLVKYPSATDITWIAKKGYLVADFKLPELRETAVNNLSNSAWFDNTGKWYMTETDIPFSLLPAAVKTAIQESEYATWTVDDVDKIERDGTEIIYVIEVETVANGIKTEVDLYYSPDGVLTRKIIDPSVDYDYHDYIPSQTTGSIKGFINTNFPNARILEIDRENGMTEVDILDGTICRELLFDASENWIFTKTEMRKANVPNIVIQALNASGYSAYRIDDIDHYKYSDKEFYRFDLESALGDIKVDITPEGVLTLASGQGNGNGNNNSNGSMLKDVVQNFIAGKYPNAVIREYDYDDGLLEVEIYHENREKDVYFNGKNEWVKTEWDVRNSELPAAVTTAIKNSQYNSYFIDDIEYVQTPTAEYYRIELEKGNREVKLNITAAGVII